MAKFLLINPANHLFGENFNLQGDMQADIHIKASISAHMPYNVINNINVTESKWPTLSTPLMLFAEILVWFDQNGTKVTRKVHKDMKIGSKE